MMLRSDNERVGIERFLALMPARYIISLTPERVSGDYALWREVTEKGFGFRVKEDPAGTAEIIVGAWDRPGLFSRIVGVLSSLGMNIYRARAYTGSGGIVIDKIQITNWGDICWDGLCQDLEGRLRRRYAEAKERSGADLAFRRSGL